MTAPPQPGSTTLRGVVPETMDGARLDRVLATLTTDYSRSRIKELVREGAARVDGEVLARPGAPVKRGQALEIDVRPRERRAGGVERDLEVLWEDEHLAVIDKPPGMLAHPTGTAVGGTVSDLARERWGELPTLQGRDRPGIVHRLDAGTSGAMLVARSKDAFEGLMNQFRARRVEKTYEALVYGVPRFDTGWIEGSLARSERDPSRMEISEASDAKEASTYYETAERFDAFARVVCKPKTGRTHQIRVHLTSIEHPLVGDTTYRRRSGPAVVLPGDAPIPPRQALHARALRFAHPVTRQTVEVEAPLAPDFRAMLDWLRVNRPSGE